MLKLARKSLYFPHCKTRTSENGANLLGIIGSYQITPNSFKGNNARCTQDEIQGQKGQKLAILSKNWQKNIRKLLIFHIELPKSYNFK